jgi:hypothetical protein
MPSAPGKTVGEICPYRGSFYAVQTENLLFRVNWPSRCSHLTRGAVTVFACRTITPFVRCRLPAHNIVGELLQGVMLELPVKPHGRTFRTLSLTCALDGLDHFVSDAGPATKIMGRSGVHTALCGHLIQVVALVSPPGPVCPRCTQLVTALRAASSSIRPVSQRRGGRLRRLLGYLQTLTLPKLDGHLGGRPAGLTSAATPQLQRVSRATVLARYHLAKTT